MLQDIPIPTQNLREASSCVLETERLTLRRPTLGSLALFAAAGVTSVVALLCINRSLKLAPASVVVPYQYSMIVWAVIFGFVVWGDVPSISTLIGAVIIIGAGFYIFLREQKLGREEAVVNPPA